MGRNPKRREGPTAGLGEGREIWGFSEYRATRITLSAGKDARQLSLRVSHYPQGVYNIFPQGRGPSLTARRNDLMSLCPEQTVPQKKKKREGASRVLSRDPRGAVQIPNLVEAHVTVINISLPPRFERLLQCLGLLQAPALRELDRATHSMSQMQTLSSSPRSSPAHHQIDHRKLALIPMLSMMRQNWCNHHQSGQSCFLYIGKYFLLPLRYGVK
jgi:hypothetical protein